MFRVETFNEEDNEKPMYLELDLIDKKRFETLTCLVVQKRKFEKYYNSKIKRRTFAIKSLVLRKVFKNNQLQYAGVLRTN